MQRVTEDRSIQTESGAEEAQQIVRTISELLDQNCFNVFRPNPTARQHFPILVFGQVWVTSKHFACPCERPCQNPDPQTRATCCDAQTQ